MYSEDVLLKYENKKIKLDDHILTYGEMARWMLLFEAMDYIAAECEERGKAVDYNFITSRIKPHKAITKYIEDRFDATLFDLVQEMGGLK